MKPRKPHADGTIYSSYYQPHLFEWYDPPLAPQSRYEITIDGGRYWKPATIKKLIRWLEACLKEIEKKK